MSVITEQIEKPKTQKVVIQKNLLRAAIDSIADLNDTVVMDAEYSKICARTMDPSHVGLIDVEIYAQVDDFKSVQIGVDKLKSGLKGGAKNDLLNVTNSENSLAVEVDEYSEIVLKKTPSEKCNIPSLSYDASVYVDTVEFFDLLKSAKNEGNYIELTSLIGGKSLICKTINGDEAKTTKVLNTVSGTVHKNSTTKYSLEYLFPFLRSVKNVESDILVSFKDGAPLRLQIVVPGLKIEYHLAPRVRD